MFKLFLTDRLQILEQRVTVKNSKEEEQIRQRNKDAYQSAAIYWNGLANERLFEISKQLLAVAFILLPLTGTILFSDKMLSPRDSFLLVLSWVIILSSIILGFITFWLDSSFFQELSKDSSQRTVIWSDPLVSINKMYDETSKLEQTKPNSTFIPLILQGATLFIGVVFVLLVVHHLLMGNKVQRKFINIDNHQNFNQQKKK